MHGSRQKVILGMKYALSLGAPEEVAGTERKTPLAKTFRS